MMDGTWLERTTDAPNVDGPVLKSLAQLVLVVCLLGVATETGWGLFMTYGEMDRGSGFWIPGWQTVVTMTALGGGTLFLLARAGLVPMLNIWPATILYSLFAGVFSLALPPERPYVDIREVNADGLIIDQFVSDATCPLARLLEDGGRDTSGGGRIYVERRSDDWRRSFLLGRPPECLSEFKPQTHGAAAWLFGFRVIGKALWRSLLRGGLPLLLLLVLVERSGGGRMVESKVLPRSIWTASICLIVVLLLLGTT